MGTFTAAALARPSIEGPLLPWDLPPPAPPPALSAAESIMLPWDAETALPASPLRTHSNASTWSGEGEEFDPDVFPDTRHDDARAIVERDFAPIVDAMQPVIARIYAIEEAPPRPASRNGTCTPLWRDKFDLGDGNFLKRLIPLTLLHPLVHEHHDAPQGAMQLLAMFDSLPQDGQVRVVHHLLALQAQLGALRSRIGSERLERLMIYGLETGAWDSGPEAREDTDVAREAGNHLLQITESLPRIIDNALIAAAVTKFRASLPD